MTFPPIFNDCKDGGENPLYIYIYILIVGLEMKATTMGARVRARNFQIQEGSLVGIGKMKNIFLFRYLLMRGDVGKLFFHPEQRS